MKDLLFAELLALLFVSVVALAQNPPHSTQPAPPNVPLCTTDQPLYTGDEGKPIWLDNDSLLKSARHCASPKMPALARTARIEGYVS